MGTQVERKDKPIFATFGTSPGIHLMQQWDARIFATLPYATPRYRDFFQNGVANSQNDKYGIAILICGKFQILLICDTCDTDCHHLSYITVIYRFYLRH